MFSHIFDILMFFITNITLLKPDAFEAFASLCFSPMAFSRQRQRREAFIAFSPRFCRFSHIFALRHAATHDFHAEFSRYCFRHADISPADATQIFRFHFVMCRQSYFFTRFSRITRYRYAFRHATPQSAADWLLARRGFDTPPPARAASRLFLRRSFLSMPPSFELISSISIFDDITRLKTPRGHTPPFQLITSFHSRFSADAATMTPFADFQLFYCLLFTLNASLSARFQPLRRLNAITIFPPPPRLLIFFSPPSSC
jgi:hypothetical protein